jgi:hypothetical protein
MNEPALTEAVQTDLTSAKPNRRKGLTPRFAVLVAAVSALGAAYWFTRPPELVWWRSPPVRGVQYRVRALVPLGWECNTMTPRSAGGLGDMGIVIPPTNPQLHGPDWEVEFHFFPRENVPSFVKRLFNVPSESGSLLLVFNKPEPGKVKRIYSVDRPTSIGGIEFGRHIPYSANRIWAYSEYQRSDVSAFNRTYRQICDSLTIE